MEEHRLSPMKEGYDEEMFIRLYNKTEALKKKLAYQIDCRRLGVNYEEVCSWFDVKFIFIFNKYCDKYNEEVLKGHLISGLTFFKQRILKKIYSEKNKVNDTIDISEIYNEKELEIEPEYIQNENIYMTKALSYMKENLSIPAYQVLKLELNPPLFIIDQLKRLDDKKYSTNKIPSYMIADFFGLDTKKESIKYINSLRQEIKSVIEEAKFFFLDNPI